MVESNNFIEQWIASESMRSIMEQTVIEEMFRRGYKLVLSIHDGMYFKRIEDDKIKVDGDNDGRGIE